MSGDRQNVDSAARFQYKRGSQPMDASPATENSSALAHRDFRRFLGASFLAILATQIQSVAVSWQIYAISRTPLALAPP